MSSTDFSSPDATPIPIAKGEEKSREDFGEGSDFR